MSTIEITEAVASKILAAVDRGLAPGLGRPYPGKMCIEAVICNVLGLPHGDDPPCVAKSLRAIKIGLNDACWSSPQARAKGLRTLALLQLDSKGVLDEKEFIRRVVLMTVNKFLPRTLRRVGLHTFASECEKVTTLKAAHTAAATANAAYAATAEELTFFAGEVADILVKMEVPGIQWLGLL